MGGVEFAVDRGHVGERLFEDNNGNRNSINHNNNVNHKNNHNNVNSRNVIDNKIDNANRHRCTGNGRDRDRNA